MFSRLFLVRPLFSCVSHFSSSSPLAPLSRYQSLLASNSIRPDPRQLSAVQSLDELHQAILPVLDQLRRLKAAAAESQPATQPQPHQHQHQHQHHRAATNSVFLKRFQSLLSSIGQQSDPKSAASGSSAASSPLVRGLYLFGGVGSGKSMLMDLFADCLPSDVVYRVHFHSFMLQFHAQLHSLKQNSPTPIASPIPYLAAQLIASRGLILCLDEFQVTDVADAMIIRLLFESLWSRGAILVATSNRRPDDLYFNGLNRSVFLPFIDDLKKNCRVWPIDNGVDHRLLGALNAGAFHSPLSPATEEKLLSMFKQLSSDDESPAQPLDLPVLMNRVIRVPLASRRAAMFTFADLCLKPLGTADYLAIARRFDYLFVSGIPQISLSNRETVRRFINLLDILYDNRVKLICSCAEQPRNLFVHEGQASQSNSVQDETFASSRAVSRLIEMQSIQYWESTKNRNQTEPGQ